MKKLKLLIIILILFVVCIMCMLLALYVMKSEKEYINIHEDEYNNFIIENNIIQNEVIGHASSLTVDESLKKETEKSILHSITNNINSYFNYIKAENNTAVSELGGNNTYKIDDDVKYVVKQVYSTENLQMIKYFTYGILTISNGDFTAEDEEVYIEIIIDKDNNSYNIVNITKEQYQNRNELSQDEDIEILQGQYNKFEYIYLDSANMMQAYLDDFSFNILNDIEKTYNMLDEEYRNKRFGKIENFITYVQEKQNDFSSIKLIQYTTEEKGQELVYKGTDEKGNYFYIREKNYMEYIVILDSYTMQEDYSNEEDIEKIKKHTEKFILMINSADYNNAYKLLEPAFRSKYFPTEQEFISYVKTNWYERNIIASKEVKQDGICIVTIKETVTSTSNKMQKEFKVTLGEGMDFTIEFNL